MNRHLTVISYVHTLFPYFEDVALQVRTREGQKFARCQTLSGLRECVIQSGRGRVTLLDLVGHGSPTYFQLGDEVLWDRGMPPADVLESLDDDLHADAQVRLLGCNTGVGRDGVEMLKQVSAALSGREVLGTTSFLQTWCFDENGFKPTSCRLVSSRSQDIVEPSPVIPVDPDDKSLELARQWLESVPKGYVAVGRGEPLARCEAHCVLEGVRLSLACDRRLVLIEDAPALAPLLLSWSGSGPAPSLDQFALDFV